VVVKGKLMEVVMESYWEVAMVMYLEVVKGKY
jgi:hypothetical protein